MSFLFFSPIYDIFPKNLGPCSIVRECWVEILVSTARPLDELAVSKRKFTSIPAAFISLILIIPVYLFLLSKQQSADYDSDNTMASSNGLPEAFASNELVGERLLIAKPAPPPGLILLKKHAPISQEPQAVFNSQPVFKRATPVRMLGDMVRDLPF
jgi:hypothetical protein